MGLFALIFNVGSFHILYFFFLISSFQENLLPYQDTNTFLLMIVQMIDFICSEREEESFFSSDTDDEKDLSRQRKGKLCPRYVDDQVLNEAKGSNLTKDLEKRIILFLRVKMTRVCLTLSLIN